MKLPGRKRSCRTEEQLVLVQDSVTASPEKSIRPRLEQLDFPTTSLHGVLGRAFSILIKYLNNNSFRS